MKLSKKSFEELLKKTEARFPRFMGTSVDNGVWQKFCAKNPIEFCGEINGAKYILRLTTDGYAICNPNPTGSFRVYSFK